MQKLPHAYSFLQESDPFFQLNCHSVVTICFLLSFCKRDRERNRKKMFVYNLHIVCNYGVIAVSAMQQGVKFEVLKRCYIQIYPAKFLLCYEKNIALQHM